MSFKVFNDGKVNEMQYDCQLNDLHPLRVHMYTIHNVKLDTHIHDMR